jgi:hypothetical protein
MMTTVAGVGGSPTNQTAKGTVTINGTGTLTANNVVMAILLGTGGSSTGTLNITNGTLAVGTLAVGTGTSIINLNGGTFIVTNTAGTPAAPLTALNLTGGNLQLNVNGSSIVTNIVATAVHASGTTTITIGSVANVTGTTNFPLISYTGTDPFAGLSLAPLPSGFTGNLSDNASNRRIDLSVTQTMSSVTAPKLGGITFTSGGGGCGFCFTNVPGASFTVYATTDLTLPFSNWPVVGHPVETSEGSYSQYQFTDPEAGNNVQRFYRVSSP